MMFNSSACIELAIDDDERSMLNIGRQGNTNVVNEAGLYNLALLTSLLLHCIIRM